ncbi:hypothetical protein D3C86_1615290 [compost metagenome]
MGKPYGADCLARLTGVPKDKRSDKSVWVVASRVGEIERVSMTMWKATYTIEGVPGRYVAQGFGNADELVNQLPEGALMILDPKSKPVFKTLSYSKVDGLVHTDKYGNVTTKPL